MSIDVMNANGELETNIYVQNYEFPERVIAHNLVLGIMSDIYQVYYPVVKAAILVRMDDDRAIGNAKCSVCSGSIGLFDKYCSHCGAKLVERQYIDDSVDEQ